MEHSFTVLRKWNLRNLEMEGSANTVIGLGLLSLNRIQSGLLPATLLDIMHEKTCLHNVAY
jgi:hypothetical protein